MKPIVKCSDCSKCVVGYGVGFTGEAIMRCSKADDDVTCDDGCTMGEKGEPMKLCAAVDASIAGHEAVYGY